MSFLNITCGKCGHVADFEQWTSRPVSGELPKGQYQCPACNLAFQRRAAGKQRTFTAPNGASMTFHDKVHLVPVAPVL